MHHSRCGRRRYKISSTRWPPTLPGRPRHQVRDGVQSFWLRATIVGATEAICLPVITPLQCGGAEAHRRSTHSPRFSERSAATTHRRHRFLLSLSGVSHRPLVSKLDCSYGGRASAGRGRLLLRPLALDSCSRVGCTLPVSTTRPRRTGGSPVATTSNN